MDPQQYTPNSNTTPNMGMGGGEKKSHTGPVIGAVIIILIIIFGGLYFWGSQLEQRDEQNGEELPFLLGDGDDLQGAGLPPVSTSDAVGDIESDINAVDFNAFEQQLDADLTDIEVQL